jgi:ABC-type phosphate/phosphonate transport system permease subunit
MRAINEIVFALIFVVAVGLGPFAGRAFSFSKIAIARTFLPSMFGLVLNIN